MAGGDLGPRGRRWILPPCPEEVQESFPEGVAPGQGRREGSGRCWPAPDLGLGWWLCHLGKTLALLRPVCVTWTVVKASLAPARKRGLVRHAGSELSRFSSQACGCGAGSGRHGHTGESSRAGAAGSPELEEPGQSHSLSVTPCLVRQALWDF